MKKGMQKFTKVCLLTALVTFILGCILCGAGGLLGGFRQLEGMDIRGITGIPFIFYKNDGFFYGFGDDAWDTEESWSGDWAKYEKWDSLNSADKVQLDLTADSLRNLYVEMGACELRIEESADDHAWLAISGNTRNFRYHVEDGDTLWLVRKGSRTFWNWTRKGNVNSTKVSLYLPEGAELNFISMELGAVNMESIALQAHELQMEVGAGVCEIDGIKVDGTAELSVGAGKIALRSLAAVKADIDVGAGELYIDGAQISREADIGIGMGNVNIGGVITGDLDVDCGMGSLTLRMEDAEEDHNYEIECSMGNVTVGSRSYTALAEDRSIYHNSSSTFEIECSMGNVTVSFAE